MALPGIFNDTCPIIHHLLDFTICCLVVHIPKYGEYVRQKSRGITEKILFPIVLSGIALFVPYIIASSNSITISYVQMVCLTELAVELNNVQHFAETNTPLSQLKHNIVPNSSIAQALDRFIQIVVQHKLSLPRKRLDFYLHFIDFC